MNKKNKKIIENKIKTLKKLNKRVFFKNVKTYDYIEFKERLNSSRFVLNCIDDLSKGSVFILKNSVKSDFLEKMKIKLNKITKNKKPISPRIINGVKNGFYISNQLSSKGYKTVDKSFYFFSWNKDTTGIYYKIIDIYKPLKILNGLKPTDFTKNTPKDGIIERVHIINYPINSGLISQHYDPTNVTIFNFGIYATEFGVDYNKGGFFVLKNKNKKIFIDKKVKKTDALLFSPSLVHGVDKVKNLKQKKTDGRWFVNVNLAQSHEVKNRQYTKKY